MTSSRDSEHYLKEGSEDRDPMPRLPGEVWSDLLARMEEPERGPFENRLRTPDPKKCHPEESESEESRVVSEGRVVTQAEFESATFGFGGWGEGALRPSARSKVT